MLKLPETCFQEMAQFLNVKHLIASKRISKKWNKRIEKDELWSNIFKNQEPNEPEILEFVQSHERKKFLHDSEYVKTLDQEECSEMLKNANEIRSLIIMQVTDDGTLDHRKLRKVNVIQCWGDQLPAILLQNPDMIPFGIKPTFQNQRGIRCIRIYVKYKESNEKATFIMQRMFQYCIATQRLQGQEE